MERQQASVVVGGSLRQMQLDKVERVLHAAGPGDGWSGIKRNEKTNHHWAPA